MQKLFTTVTILFSILNLYSQQPSGCVSPNPPSAPQGPSYVCPGTESTIYSVSRVPNATLYQFSVSPMPNIGVVTTVADTAIKITWDAMFCGVVEIYALATNSCGTSYGTPIYVDVVCRPTIEPTGPFCLNTQSVQLTANIPGGVWSGCNIDVNGNFTPATVGQCNVTYTVQQGACASQGTAILTVDPQPEVIISAQSAVCQGDVVSLTANIVGGMWMPSNTFVANNPGTNSVGYVVQYNYGCFGADTFLIEVIQPPLASFTYTIDSICSSICVTNTTIGIVSTTWDLGNGETSTGLNPCIAIVDLQDIYCVTLNVANACGIDDTTICITAPCVGITENFFSQSITMFPNPANEQLNILFGQPVEGAVSISLLDVLGKALISEKRVVMANSTCSLPLQGIAPGIYMLQITNQQGLVATKKLVVN